MDMTAQSDSSPIADDSAGMNLVVPLPGPQKIAPTTMRV